MTDIEIQKYLEGLYNQIQNAKKWKVELTTEWKKQFPNFKGVYCIFDNTGMIYVGETSNIRERMGHLMNSRHHTLRRTLGEKYFSDREGFEKATSKKKFGPKQVEEDLEKYMRMNLTVAFIEVKLGRKELEEYIQTKHHSTLLNKRP